MDSMDELYYALFTLTGDATSSNDKDKLWWISRNAREIADIFAKSNLSLSEAWLSIAEFYGRMDQTIIKEFTELKDEVTNYVIEVRKNEEELKNVVINANNEADNILKELEIQ